MLKLQDIENSLAAKITLEIPTEPVLYLKAVNEGIPVVRGAPRRARRRSASIDSPPCSPGRPRRPLARPQPRPPSRVGSAAS